MKATSGWQIVVSIGASLWLAPASYAVMPPEAEARAALERIERMAVLRAEAPEQLRVQIQSVSAQRVDGNLCPAVENWTIIATVMSSERGAAVPGQTVRLHYEVEHYRCPGPVREHWPMLQTGMEIDALLRCDSDQCEPAAGPMSFLSAPAFAAEHARRVDEVKRYAPIVKH